MRGGKREGAGRKPAAEPTALFRLRFPIPIHQQITELGGDIWLKRIINEALQNLKGK